MFKVRVFRTICSNCRLRGRNDCNHNVEMPWSSYEQDAKMKAMMGGTSEEFMREIRNEDVKPNITKAFTAASVEALDGSQYQIMPYERIKHVFIGIDPAAGGRQSKFARVSLIVIERNQSLQSGSAPERVFQNGSDRYDDDDDTSPQRDIVVIFSHSLMA